MTLAMMFNCFDLSSLDEGTVLLRFRILPIIILTDGYEYLKFNDLLYYDTIDRYPHS